MRVDELRTRMTPREKEQFEQEMVYAKTQAEYQLKFKEMEQELRRLETQWTQILRLPFALLSLPVRMLMAVGYIAHAIKGKEPSKDFWDFIKRL